MSELNLKERVDAFNLMELPGQPLGMHMGTAHLVVDLWSEVQKLQRQLAEAQEEIARMKPVVEAAKAYKAAGDEVIRLYDLEEDINTAMGDRQQAENLLFLTICDLEHEQLTPNDLHDWQCISSGEYDFTNQCTRCGKKNVESIDNPSTDNPVHGCSGVKEDG